MNNILRFQQAVEKISEVAPLLVGEAQQEFKTMSEAFLNDVQESQYIKVPLVGSFSAGKSSLLNVFTQKPGMLPVDTMPETAVAYELYYGVTESVELYRKGQKVDTKPLANIAALTTQPGDVAKVYCDSSSVKALQERGIVLVDMPGIGSGIERHDAAIFNYIGTGAAFILIVDADQGSLRGNTLAFMQELNRYNMQPAVLVSKIDKKPEAEVKEIVEYIEYQLKGIGHAAPSVGTICAVNNDLGGLERCIDALNPEALMATKFKGELTAITKNVMEQLSIRVNIRSKEVADIEAKMKAIEAEIDAVKAELPTANNNADTPEKSTQDILDNLRAALEAKAGDIAQMIQAGEDVEDIKAAIISIVRSEIISSLKEESEQYSAALGSAVQEAVKDLETIEVSTDIMKDFSEIINVVQALLANFPIGGTVGKIVAALLPFLPNILNWLFGKSDSDVLAEIHDKVLSKCVEPILREIQPTIFKIVVENQKLIQQKMQRELVSKMENTKEGLREKMADAGKSKAEVEAELAKLNDAIAHLQSVISSL